MDTIKGIYLKVIIVLLFVLSAQQVFNIIPLKALRGEFIPKEKITLTLESWFNKAYQDSLEGYLNENFGFRSFFVRVNHQINYSLFNKVSSMAVQGKNNHFYISDYIDSYYGKDFYGLSVVNDTISHLKFLNDTLTSMGKTFLVVMAPNKARIYPEFIPDEYKKESTTETNYDYYVKGLKTSGVNFIDFTPLFFSKKPKSEYLLFSQLGVHWSRLEAVRAADTILGHLSYLSKSPLPRIKIKEIIQKDSLEYPDYDIADGMNTLWYPPFAKMGYPEIEYITENKVKKKALVIADSYWTDIFFRGIPRNVFSINEFWYYNKSSWGNHYSGKKEVKDRDLKRTILQYDIIILLCTETNFEGFGFGFPGAAKNALRRTIAPTRDEISAIKTQINYNEKWLSDIKEKAIKSNISVDSMMTLDAMWYFQHCGPIIKKKTIEDVQRDIYGNKEWMETITKKAKERNISLDSMVQLDAKWFFDTQLPADEKEIKPLSLADIKNSIKTNPTWLKDVEKKAKQRGLSVDSMMTLDAIWYKQQFVK